MRITKLITGIFLLLLSIWLLIDGIMDGILGTWFGSNLVVGVLEIILAGILIAAGIIYIIFENSDSLGGSVTGLILLIVAGVIGIVGGFFNHWLFLYAAISLLIGIGFFIWERIDD